MEDPVWRTLFRAIKAYFDTTELPITDRMIHAGWFLSVALSPRVFARRLIALRFLSTERPVWLQLFLTFLAKFAAARGPARIPSAES